MAQDILTTQKLVDTYQLNNEALKSRIDLVLSAPRVLDGPPPKYTPMRIESIEVIEPFSVYTDYRRSYTALYQEQPPADSHIIIGDETVACPYRVLTALKTLVLCGVSKSSERANACRELFGAILSRRKNEVLDEDLMSEALRSKGDYYKDEIIRALRDSVFDSEEQVVMWLKDALKDNYSEDVLTLFPNIHDVDSLEDEIKKQYKRACCDPEFKVRKHLGRTVNVVNYLRRNA